MVENPLVPEQKGGDAKAATAPKKGKRTTNKKTTIPYACMKRIAQQASGNMRISGDAVSILGSATEEFIKKLVNKSKSYTTVRQRKTITFTDVKAALDNYGE